MRYDLLLADADGTLFDFHAGEKQALATAFSAYALPPDEETIALYSRINQGHWKRLERGETTPQRLKVERFADFLQALAQRGTPVPEAQPEALAARFIQELSRQHVPMPGAEAFLKRVAAQMPVYLVTNGIARVQRSRFETSPLRVYLADLLISEELGHFKPDPFMILEAMRRAGVTDKRRAVMLGDSITADMGAAVNAGIDGVLLTNDTDIKETGGAASVVNTLAEAAEIVLAQ